MTSSPQDEQTIELWLNCQSSPHTRSCYLRDAARLAEHVGNKPLAAITLGDLQGFAQSLVEAGLAPVSRARTIAAIKSLFGFCARIRVILLDPAAELPLPCYASRLSERILAEEDVQRILAAEADPRDKTLLNLIYVGGLRVSEATGLCWRNLRDRGDAGQITVFGKGGQTRTIALPATVWLELTALRQDAAAEDPVFRSRTGLPLDRGRVRMIVRQAAEQAGVDANISPHWLRHAHASHALDHGAPIHLVQATLGHSSVATTSGYLHARPGDSSARFLAAERVSPEFSKSGKSALPSKRTGVMDVSAAAAAQGATTMTTNAEGQATTPETSAATSPAAEPKQPKANKKAAVAPQKPKGAPAKAKASKKATQAKKTPKSAKKAQASKAEGVREGSKTAKALAMLSRPDGATLAELMKALSWQAHSVRGFISGTLGKKMGLKVESTKSESGDRTYRIGK